MKSKDRAEQCINYTYNYVPHLSQTKQTFLLKEIFPALDAQEFNLNHFVKTVILMTHTTVDQKVGAIYDLYDLFDGNKDCISPQNCLQFIAGIFKRTMYYIPRHQLANMVEYIFTG